MPGTILGIKDHSPYYSDGGMCSSITKQSI